MSGTRTFPLRAAAALFIERQQLERPRRRRLTRATLQAFAEAVGGIQLDSINVLERAHLLTLWSRFGPYSKARLERLVYRERVLFEYWAHAACLVPATHLPAWRRAMLDYHFGHTGWTRFLRRNGKMLKLVEEAVRERGPLANADFEHRRPRGQAGWWSWKPATHALHGLWMTGRLLVHSRTHFQKRFDLAERIFPDLPKIEPISADAFQRWRIERSLHAMGAATTTDLTGYLTFPRAAAGVRRRALQGLIAAGEATEIAIAGDRNRWVALTRDLPHLGRAARMRQACRGTTLLAPFDSFLWYRARTLRLFGFDYRIEVYTPGHKRVHGYYTLPILHQGALIGRLDAKNHRAKRALEVRHVSFEDWFARGAPAPAASWGAIERDQAIAGIAEALGSLATFLGAEEISVARATPSTLLAPLRRAIAAAPVRPAEGRAAAPALER